MYPIHRLVPFVSRILHVQLTPTCLRAPTEVQGIKATRAVRVPQYTSQYGFSTSKDDPSSGKSQTREQLKQTARQFYQTQVENIIELEDMKHWEKLIPNLLEPIILDFYATWCQPCKVLGPKLQQRVTGMNGMVKLIKIDIDKFGELASKLKIKAVPTLVLVHMGQVFDIISSVDDAKLDKMFEIAIKMFKKVNSAQIAMETLEEAKQFITQGAYEEAEKKLLTISSSDQEEVVSLRNLFLAYCYQAQAKTAKFIAQIDALKPEQFKVAQIRSIYDYLVDKSTQIKSEKSQNPTLVKIQEQLAKDPTNLSLIFELATTYRQLNMPEQALEAALSIVKQNNAWQDKKANKLMLQMFKELGNDNAMTQKYRRLFQRLLH